MGETVELHFSPGSAAFLASRAGSLGESPPAFRHRLRTRKLQWTLMPASCSR